MVKFTSILTSNLAYIWITLFWSETAWSSRISCNIYVIFMQYLMTYSYEFTLVHDFYTSWPLHISLTHCNSIIHIWHLRENLIQTPDYKLNITQLIFINLFPGHYHGCKSQPGLVSIAVTISFSDITLVIATHFFA